jgi:hypothetical protein
MAANRSANPRNDDNLFCSCAVAVRAGHIRRRTRRFAVFWFDNGGHRMPNNCDCRAVHTDMGAMRTSDDQRSGRLHPAWKHLELEMEPGRKTPFLCQDNGQSFWISGRAILR